MTNNHNGFDNFIKHLKSCDLAKFYKRLNLNSINQNFNHQKCLPCHNFIEILVQGKNQEKDSDIFDVLTLKNHFLIKNEIIEYLNENKDKDFLQNKQKCFYCNKKNIESNNKAHK